MKSRKLVYDFLKLSYVIREQIIRDLGLNDINDNNLTEQDVYFKRATTQNKVEALTNAVELQNVIAKRNSGTG